MHHADPVYLQQKARAHKHLDETQSRKVHGGGCWCWILNRLKRPASSPVKLAGSHSGGSHREEMKLSGQSPVLSLHLILVE